MEVTPINIRIIVRLVKNNVPILEIILNLTNISKQFINTPIPFEISALNLLSNEKLLIWLEIWMLLQNKENKAAGGKISLKSTINPNWATSSI